MANDKAQKEIILSAAMHLFSRFGLEKTTMEDIAKASKKGKSSLYYYFKSKEEVFAEVIKKEIAGLKTSMIQAIENEDDPYNKFRKFVHARLNYLNKKADQYVTVRDEYLKNYEFIEHLISDYSHWEIETIKGILAIGRREGFFDITDLDAVSKAIFFGLKGLEYPWAINLTRKEIERSVDIIVDILLRGISKG